ncbi:flagellar export protein FliJ, partial [Stenotrophomonas maltophilia]
LAELERYRNDYQQQWISQGQKGVSGQWLMNYQRFLSQLETAVAQQANSVTWHREAVDKARLNWQERYA